ncbi:MAG: DNA mismatch repair protein MutL, partial [Acidobacteriota bacterium]
VIDQHVAHERILYDRALRSMASGTGVPSQGMLIPVTVELDAQKKAIAESILEHLNENGFDVEWFGASDLVIRAVPALAKEIDPARVIEEILEEVSHLDDLESMRPQEKKHLSRVQEKIAIAVSCRAAIKINMPLTEEKMQWLLDELFRCENPYTCPHGRPIVLRLGIEEILKGFKRL